MDLYVSVYSKYNNQDNWLHLRHTLDRICPHLVIIHDIAPFEQFLLVILRWSDSRKAEYGYYLSPRVIMHSGICTDYCLLSISGIKAS